MSSEPKRSDRITIMDGRVIDYSDEMETAQTVMGERDRPSGTFHISASRNKVEIHYASLKTPTQFEVFNTALERAKLDFKMLNRNR